MEIRAYAQTRAMGAAAGEAPTAAARATPPAAPTPTPTRESAGGTDSQPSPEQVRAAVGAINQTIQSLVSHLEFSVDPDTKVNVVKVIDTRTHEVLRQFPSEEVLSIAKALDQFKGLLLRERA